MIIKDIIKKHPRMLPEFEEMVEHIISIYERYNTKFMLMTAQDVIWFSQIWNDCEGTMFSMTQIFSSKEFGITPQISMKHGRKILKIKIAIRDDDNTTQDDFIFTVVPSTKIMFSKHKSETFNNIWSKRDNGFKFVQANFLA